MVNIQNELYVSFIFNVKPLEREIYLFKYDPIADEWTQRVSLNEGALNRVCSSYGCTVFNRMLYVVGGCDRFSHSCADVQRYNPISNEWTNVPTMLTSRRRPAVVTLGNYIYAIGGWNDEGERSGNGKYTETVERYDVLNKKWEFVASMKYERRFPEAVVFDKKIYVFGGFNNYGENNYVKIVECFDEETNEWKEVARMNEEVDCRNEIVSKVIVSYQPCVPDICENFLF